MRPSAYFEGPNATRLPTNLPYLNNFFRRNLACSLAHLLNSNSIENLLWGDLLHEVHGGLVSLPHVGIKLSSVNDTP